VIAAAHLMVVMDTTIMFVALPSAQRGLALSVSGRQWVLTAYTLAFGGLLLLGGRLADRLGARTTLRIGALGFALASALGGLSPDGAVLIAARALEGAFGALLVSSTKSLLVTVYTDEDQRARAIGIFTATLTAGAAIGLLLGGALTSLIGWRWCLYVNLPVSIAVLSASAVLPAIPPRPEVRFDLLGAALLCAGMVALVYGLGSAATDGWGSAVVTATLAAATVLIATFALRARVPGSLLPLRIVADRNRGGALFALVFNSLSTFGMMLILTYQLQSVLDESPLITGLSLAPFAVATGIAAAIIAPRLMARVPARTLIIVGIGLSAIGLVPLLALNTTSHYFPLIFLATVIEGIGTGLASPPALGASLRGVAPGDTGAAGAISSAAGQVGSSIGTALFNTIAATATAAYLAANSGASPAAATVHGYTTALAWGIAILLTALVPIAVWMRPDSPAGARPASGTGPRRA
jgi:EmrB/QacA subfamily drug resistance transporter